MRDRERNGSQGTTDERPHWEGPPENRPSGYAPAGDDPLKGHDAAGDNMNAPSSDRSMPERAARRKLQLRDLAREIRADIREEADPRIKAIFETSAEVLLSLAQTMEDFERGEEKAWR